MKARYRTVVWFAIGLAFTGVIHPLYEHGWLTLVEPSDDPGADASMMFAAAYLMECALSFDAVLVITTLTQVHRVPRRDQARVAFWATAGTVVVRAGVLVAATWLVRARSWWFVLFGVLVLLSALAAARSNLKGWLPAWRAGVGVCVLAIVASEAVLAFDVVAVLSVSTTTFIVVTSNVLATIAQRSWFFVEGVERIRFPRIATTAFLAVIGAKLLAHSYVDVPHAVWLAIVIGFVVAGIVESRARGA